MKEFSEYFGNTIKISQPSIFKRFHEIRAGEDFLGSLQQKGFFGMLWEVKLFNKAWDIYRPSCWKCKLEIREAGYEMPFADFQRSGFKSKGVLNLPKGEKLTIEPHLFKGFCEIKNLQEESLIKIKLKTGFGDKGEITFIKKADLIDKYPWVVILGYIIALEQRHRAANSAV